MLPCSFSCRLYMSWLQFHSKSAILRFTYLSEAPSPQLPNLATSSTTPAGQASLSSGTMPEPTYPSSLGPPRTNTSSTKTRPISPRTPPCHSDTYFSTSGTLSPFQDGHPSIKGSNSNIDNITPPNNDHQARIIRFKKQLQKLEKDVAKIKSLVEEREKALEGMKWEVEAQGDDMEDVEDRSARTLRGLRRLRKMDGW